jgi:hypothetical protein
MGGRNGAYHRSTREALHRVPAEDFMNTIYKYPITMSDDLEIIEMLSPARIRHVGLDPAGVPCVWAEVDTEANNRSIGFGTIKRHIHIVGTGQRLPENISALQYLGTIHEGPFIWHVYGN